MYDKFGALAGDVCLLRNKSLLTLITQRLDDFSTPDIVERWSSLKRDNVLFYVIDTRPDGQMTVLLENGEIVEFYLGAMILADFFSNFALKLYEKLQ